MNDPVTYIVYISLLLVVLSLLYYKRVISPGGLNVFADSVIISKSRFEVSHLIALLIISYIVGIRYNVGTDWLGYKEAFEWLRNKPAITFLDQDWEWGYYYINKLIASVGGHYALLFFTVAFISWLFIFRSVNSILLPFVVYFMFTDGVFFWSMSGVRQFIAFSIFLYSLQYIISKNLLAYLTFIALAYLFHKSILLLAPVYFLPFKRMNNRGFWLISLITSFIVGNVPFFIDIAESVARYVLLVIPQLSDYNYYFENDMFFAQERDTGLGFFFFQIVSLIIIIFSKDIIEKHPSFSVYIILFFIGVILYNLFVSVELISRVISYLIFLRPVVLSIVTYYFLLNKEYRAIGFVLIALYFGQYLMMIYNSSNMCSPYSFKSIYF